MASYDSEVADRDLAELNAALRPWYINRDSDSVMIQNLRASEYGVAERLLEGLIRGVRPERRVELTVGKTAVQGMEFVRGAYGFSRGQPRELEPGSTLELRKVTHAYNMYARMPEAYAGFIIKLPFSEIARTLTEEAELLVVEVPVAETAA
jgi:hypothetical protein